MYVTLISLTKSLFTGVAILVSELFSVRVGVRKVSAEITSEP